ncbi:hypothetical protein NW766_011015 [Fusarium irregulare]|uniref:Anaphase-promoting complex subunit 4-like WD40 domain-containing protein n=1 Tax=Fusarium irregulare TaxID=2494466 RepID=A0A9W8PGM5_9HYPO|nr:hypothetical protein NW766_011015 [Fusarium irregulare]
MALIDFEGSAEILDARTGSRRIFLADTGKVTCSPAKDLFAFCCNNETIQFWDGTLRSLIRIFHQFTDVFFPKGGTLVVLMSRDKVLVLEHRTLNIHWQIELSGEWIPWYEPIFTSRSLGIVTEGDERGSFKLWLFRWDTGSVAPGFPHLINDKEFSIDGLAVHTSLDGQFMLYKTMDDINKHYLVVINVEADYETSILALGEDQECASLAFSPTGNRLVIGTYSGSIFLWDMKTMALVNQLSTGMSRIFQIHYCTDERITITNWGREGNENQLWDVERVQLLRRWKVDTLGLTEVEIDRQHFSIKDGWHASPVGDETASCGTLTRRDPNLLDVEGGWLWHGNDRLLLLPSDFAPGTSRVTGGSRSENRFPVKAASTDSLVLGLKTGELAAFKFDSSKMFFKK